MDQILIPVWLPVGLDSDLEPMTQEQIDAWEYDDDGEPLRLKS